MLPPLSSDKLKPLGPDNPHFFFVLMSLRKKISQDDPMAPYRLSAVKNIELGWALALKAKVNSR
jgi:hypothetical protein